MVPIIINRWTTIIISSTTVSFNTPFDGSSQYIYSANDLRFIFVDVVRGWSPNARVGVRKTVPLRAAVKF